MINPDNPKIDARTSVFGTEPPRSIVPTPTPNETATTSEGVQSNTTSANAPANTTGSTSTTTTTSTGGSYALPTLSSSVPAEFKASTYGDIISELEKRMAAHKPLTEEQLKKLRRKQRAEGVISSIADASRAVSNLIFTHHYAPNMYDASHSMSARAQARFDKEKAQRDADADRYFNYAMMIGKLRGEDRDRGLQTWQMEQTMARQDRAYETAQRQAQAETERKAALDDLQKQLLQGQIDEQTAAAKIKGIEAEFAAGLQQSKINKNNYRPVKGGGGGRRGSTAAMKYPVFDANGEVVAHVYTRDEAISETERNGGTYPRTDRQQTTETPLGTQTTTSRSQPTAGRTPRQQKQKKRTNVKWK